MLLIVPLTIAIIVLLIRVNTQELGGDRNCKLATFSLVGAFWTLYLLGYPYEHGRLGRHDRADGRRRPAGVFMLLYLELAYANARRKGTLRSLDDLRHVILEGAAMRIRPKFMTVTTMMIGLLPIFWSTGPGSDLMKRIAAPMAGGMTSSFMMELLIYPVLYSIWRQREIVTAATTPAPFRAVTAVVAPNFYTTTRQKFICR